MDKILYAGFMSRLIKNHKESGHNVDNVTRTTNTRKTNRTSTLDAQRVISAAIATRMHLTPNSYDLRR